MRQRTISHETGDRYANSLMIHGQNAEATTLTDNAKESVTDRLKNPVEGQYRQHNPYGWAVSKHHPTRLRDAALLLRTDLKNNL